MARDEPSTLTRQGRNAGASRTDPNLHRRQSTRKPSPQRASALHVAQSPKRTHNASRTHFRTARREAQSRPQSTGAATYTNLGPRYPRPAGLRRGVRSPSAHPRFAAAGHLLQLRAFFITKFNDVSHVHPGLHRCDGDSRSWMARHVDPCEPSRAVHPTTGAISGVHSRLYEGQWAPASSTRHATILCSHRANRPPDGAQPGMSRTASPHPGTGPQPRSSRRPRGSPCLAMNNRIQLITTSVQRY